jgi:Ni/Co efflux regulator RcnB
VLSTVLRSHTTSPLLFPPTEGAATAAAHVVVAAAAAAPAAAIAPAAAAAAFTYGTRRLHQTTARTLLPSRHWHTGNQHDVCGELRKTEQPHTNTTTGACAVGVSRK